MHSWYVSQLVAQFVMPQEAPIRSRLRIGFLVKTVMLLIPAYGEQGSWSKKPLADQRRT